MWADSHRALVRRYIDEVWNGRQPAAPFFAPGYRRYLTATAPPLTGAQQQQRIIDFQAAFADRHFTVEDLVAEGDRVVFRATMRGSHQGAFRDIAPTGGPIAVAVLDLVRVEGGAFVAQWGGPDLFDLLLQLGAVVSVR
jgi:predicted ester cyclase